MGVAPVGSEHVPCSDIGNDRWKRRGDGKNLCKRRPTTALTETYCSETKGFFTNLFLIFDLVPIGLYDCDPYNDVRSRRVWRTATDVDEFGVFYDTFAV